MHARRFSDTKDVSQSWIAAGIATVICTGCLMLYQYEKNKLPARSKILIIF